MTRSVVALFALVAVLVACTSVAPTAQSPLSSVTVTVPLPTASVTPLLPTPTSTPPPTPTPVPTLFPQAGGTIAFVAFARASRQSNIVVMNADGSDLHPLPNTSGAAAVSWSPDGKRLAYIVHHSDDDWSMYVVDADGSSPTRLADTSTNDFGPTWKPASVATAAADWVNSGLQLGRGWGLALGDLNGDRYLDVVVFNDSEGNTIWLNDGTGKFVDTGQRLGTRNCWEVALGDLDRDGDLDVVLSHGDQPVPAEVWWNRLVH